MTSSPESSSSQSPGVHEAARREKLRKLQSLGIDPWGGRFDNHRPIAEIRQRLLDVTP